MEFSRGTRIESYEIISLVGSGGMGEVWRAHDERLDRDVAVKILPKSFANDRERLDRFEQEARAAGSLNHPNLVTVHDIGKIDGCPYIVMELLEGSTLREKLRAVEPARPRPESSTHASEPGRVQGIPLRKAVNYAIQIANGLAAAHDNGIIHRDLKPENIFITKDGRAKILDFGLAKIDTRDVDHEADTAQFETSPGKVLGTAGYMSPEQIRGREVDKRSDVFSFGVILFEMLSGVQAFGAESSIESMNAILTRDPFELSAQSSSMPSPMHYIIEKCIEKNPGERFRDMHDLAFSLRVIADTSGYRTLTDAGSRIDRRFAVVAAIVAALFIGTLFGLLVADRSSPVESVTPPTPRYLTYSGLDAGSSVSPDGKLLAFASSRDRNARIWIKQLSEGSEVPLTDGPMDARPRFSPDGSSVLFTRSSDQPSTIQRIPLIGGATRLVVSNAFEADWSPDGRQVAFLRSPGEGEREGVQLGKGAVDGSSEAIIHQIEGRTLYSPRWSPDGEKIAAVEGFLLGNAANVIRLVQSDGSTSRELHPPTDGRISGLDWYDDDELVYLLNPNISSLWPVGTASQLMSVDTETGAHTPLFTALDIGGVPEILPPGGVILDALSQQSNLHEQSLEARASDARWLTRGRSRDRQPAYSPGGDRIIFSSTRLGNHDLWIVSTLDGSLRRLTDDAADDWDPAFTAEGDQIIWSSSRSGTFEIWRANLDGSGARQISNDGYDAENPTMTPDGWIVYASLGAQPKRGLWKMRLDGSEAQRFFEGTVNIPEVSPDGKFVIYNEPTVSGGMIRVVDLNGDEVFSTSFDRSSGRNNVGRARWFPDGRRFVFEGEDESGRSGLYVQDFAPGRNTIETRRPIIGFESGRRTESFGISPDGESITIAWSESGSTIIAVDNVLPNPENRDD